MSFSAMHWALERRGLTRCQRCVLMVLASHASNNTGEAWPTIRAIAEKAEISRRSVINALQALTAKGEIEQTRKWGFHRATTYRMVIPQAETGAPFAPLKGAAIAPMATEGCKTEHEKGAAIAPESIKKESINPSTLASLGTRAREEDDAPVIQTQREDADERDDQPAVETHRGSGLDSGRDDQHPVLAPAATPSQGAHGRRQPAARGSRCPADWQPSPSLVAFGAAEGLTEAQVRRERDRMHDWSWSARGSVGFKTDWDRAFRNWLRRRCDDDRPRTVVVEKTVTLAPRAPSGQEQAIANLRAKLAATGSLFDPPAVFGHAD